MRPTNPSAPLDFDPYRFGAPEHPVPPEYAPPGYKPPPSLEKPLAGPGDGLPGRTPTGSSQVGTPPPPGYPPTGYAANGLPASGVAAAGASARRGIRATRRTRTASSPAGYPPVPPQYNAQQYPAPPTSNGRATASLVLGIVSIFLCIATLFDIIPIALAITFGVIGRRNAIRDPRVGGKGAATAGIVCAAVGAVLAITALVILSRATAKCSDFSQGSTGWTNCVEHQVHLK